MFLISFFLLALGPVYFPFFSFLKGKGVFWCGLVLLSRACLLGVGEISKTDTGWWEVQTSRP